MCFLQLRRKRLGSPSGPGPTLGSRLPMRNSTKEGVRRGMASDSEESVVMKGVEGEGLEGENTEEK